MEQVRTWLSCGIKTFRCQASCPVMKNTMSCCIEFSFLGKIVSPLKTGEIVSGLAFTHLSRKSGRKITGHQDET